MDEQIANENKGRVRNSNFLLVCGLLAVYVVCVLASLGAIYRGFQREKQAHAVNVTSTAHAVATQQGNVTATAMARATEQGLYEFIERFDQVSARWFVGPSVKQYGDVRYSIADGVYIWDIRRIADSTISVDFYKRNLDSQFDSYVDVKFIHGKAPEFLCAGLAYRTSRDNWEQGAVIFTICQNGHYLINFYDASGWTSVTREDRRDLIDPEGWNRLALSARNDHFVFSVNTADVFEMTDDRLPHGDLAIYLQGLKDDSAEVWFDNFGYQSR